MVEQCYLKLVVNMWYVRSVARVVVMVACDAVPEIYFQLLIFILLNLKC